VTGTARQRSRNRVLRKIKIMGEFYVAKVGASNDQLEIDEAMSSHSDGNDTSNGETMRYGMLGSDEATTAEKLEKYLGEVEWDYLEPHYKNGAILWLDPSLSITEVGEALTNDDITRVEEWKNRGDLVTPSAPHAFYWEESKAVFRALVVSPFVLIQPIGEAEVEG
jgi:hypothetical protein